ncbi:MAG: protein-glutamate O-methyltransferase CheR [Planctomycetes bacterium]|nr:protein-glutamate O-methyltransferase CheR [Planctomycetota bacterium]
MNCTSLSTDSLSFVCALVRGRSAMELAPDKAYLIESRLAAVAKKNGFANNEELVHGVRGSPRSDLVRHVVEAMTINETSFFRDMHPFEALRKTIIPELRARRSDRRQLNIWSAACSSGQELYSIAMLLREYFPDLLGWELNLLGTDLSREVVYRAQRGRFSQIEVNRGLPAPLLLKYFERAGVHWDIVPEVRRMVRFQELNLIDNWTGMPSMDVVLLRNVLIYFSGETKKRILARVRRLMTPHTVLFLGGAETPSNVDPSLEQVQANNSIFYRLNRSS